MADEAETIATDVATDAGIVGTLATDAAMLIPGIGNIVAGINLAVAILKNGPLLVSLGEDAAKLVSNTLINAAAAAPPSANHVAYVWAAQEAVAKGVPIDSDMARAKWPALANIETLFG